jgi:hypothetical protein
MSCCQTDDHTVTVALVFVLPEPAPFTSPVVITRAVALGSVAGMLIPVMPLSPPPRVS